MSYTDHEAATEDPNEPWHENGITLADIVILVTVVVISLICLALSDCNLPRN